MHSGAALEWPLTQNTSIAARNKATICLLFVFQSSFSAALGSKKSKAYSRTRGTILAQHPA
eukprot:2463914-Amphidinium_carterae.1